MDLFLNLPPRVEDPLPPPNPSKPIKLKKKKTTKAPKAPPEPAHTGVGQYHAAFTPMPPEVNEPQAIEDPFGSNAFAPCMDEDLWEEEDVNEVQEEAREEDGESWGAYDSGSNEVTSDCEDVSISSSPPNTTPGDDLFQNFMSRRRKSLREQKAVYSGPQLAFDDEEEDDGCV